MNLKIDKNQLKGIIFLLITAIIWGGSFISQLFGGAAVGPFSFSAYRGIVGCISIYIMIIFDNYFKGHGFVFFRKDENVMLTLKSSLICGVVLFSALITQQVGVQNTDTAKAGLIASLEVVCVPIIMFIVYKRKIRFITWAFIILAMIGIMMLSLNSITGINIGDVWVFISTILYSITIIQIPLYINGVDPLKFSFFRFLCVGIFSFICTIIFKEEMFNIVKVKNAIMSILYSGILASGVAYTLQIIGQKYCEPVIATLIMSLEGIFAAILGWIILGQSLNFVQILGIIIAFISIVIVQITDSRI